MPSAMRALRSAATGSQRLEGFGIEALCVCYGFRPLDEPKVV